MYKLLKCLSVLLLTTIILTIIMCFSPNTFSELSKSVNLTSEQLNNILMAIDITLSSSISICSNFEQNRLHRRCKYEISIEDDNIKFNDYMRVKAEIPNSYYYKYKRSNTNIKTPFYEVDFLLDKNYTNCVSIPFLLKIKTEMIGENLIFSRFNLLSSKIIDKKPIKHSVPNKFLKIVNPISDNENFLIRLQLLCKPKHEEQILNSCICIGFTITFTNDIGIKHKKYVLQEIQHINGTPLLLSTKLKSNWVLYTLEYIRIKYRFYK